MTSLGALSECKMNIKFQNIDQKDIEYAIECLEICKQDHAREYGFNYPYFTPGGAYGKQWWQLDSSLALCGYKWVDRAFAERALLNFIESQKADGRICLWGKDRLPNGVAGGDFPQQTDGVSSLPKLFDVAYNILRGSNDLDLKTKTYNMLKKYLDWWFSARQDEKTGLITAVFEETFIPYLGCSGEYAPVDTNVEVCVGCYCVELLACELGLSDDAKEVETRRAALKNSINQYLWNEGKGAYYPYLVKEGKRGECLMASTFYPLRLGIAPKDRQKRLIELLTDDSHFNMDTIPLTSVSKKDPKFTTTEGKYKGNASWSGNVWSLINETVIRGLFDCGERELASELALKTVRAFKQNCAEFLNPFDGIGHGVKQYAWTASQYLELMIERVFGVDYDAERSVITVAPCVPRKLSEESLELKGLSVAKGIVLDVVFDNGTIRANASDTSVKLEVSYENIF